MKNNDQADETEQQPDPESENLAGDIIRMVASCTWVFDPWPYLKLDMGLSQRIWTPIKWTPQSIYYCSIWTWGSKYYGQ